MARRSPSERTAETDFSGGGHHPPPTVRRGLAIVGGGALGAYSFGCLQALRENGIGFDAVAGTSAGSLNAAIWSTGRIDEGEALWSAMSPESTYDLIRPLKFLPKCLTIVPIFLVLAIGAVSARALGRRVHKKLDLVLALIAALGVGGIFAAINHLVSPHLPATQIGVATALFAFVQFSRSKSAGYIWVFLLGGVMLGTTFLIGREMPQDHFLEAIAFFGLMLGGGLFGLVLGGIVYVTLMLIQTSCFSSRPLANTVGAFLADADFKVPMYATVAEACNLWDPDDPCYRDFSSQPGEAPVNPVPNLTTHWQARYFRIEGPQTEGATKALLASAALPFGIVPPIKIGDKEYIDGGIADNCPLLPLYYHGVDEIVVLGLHPGILDPEIERHRCARIARMLTLSNRPVPERVESVEVNDPPTIVPYPELSPWPRIVTIAPDSKLAGPLALLNFSPAFARRLIEAGRSDTLAALARMERQ